MIRTAFLRSRRYINTVSEFRRVQSDPLQIKELPIQSETLCLYAIQTRSRFQSHPWKSINPCNRTSAVQLLTAVTAPQLIVEDVMLKGGLVSEIVIAAVVTTSPKLYADIPEIYKTTEIHKLYSDITKHETTKYRWGLGSFAV